jgi:hypothetical protein
VTNQAGETSYTVNVRVQIPPQIAAGLTNYNLVLGDSLTLVCEVTAEPEAIVEVTLNCFNFTTPFMFSGT